MNNLDGDIERADPDDLAGLARVIERRQREIAACTSREAAAEIFRQGEALAHKLRLARAKLRAQRAELYQAGFLLRALAADQPREPVSGLGLDVRG